MAEQESEEPDKKADAAGQTDGRDGQAAERDKAAGGSDADITSFDDDRTGRAVDDIVAAESDELLAAQDAIRGSAAVEPHHGLWWRWWHNTWARWLTILAVLGGIAALGAVPVTRYWLLNAAGVRAGASVTVKDELTNQPLKNVTVQLDGITLHTGGDGAVRFVRLKLGPSTLHIARAGFAGTDRRVILGWGSNPFGTVALQSTGAQYTLYVHDYLTGKPVPGAEVDSGEAAALSDKSGKVVLTLPDDNQSDVTATVSCDGYRTDNISIKALTTAATDVSLVTARKAVYVSKQSGKYDVYSSDADGQNRQVILAGTGNENANISLAVSPDGSHAAVVSTRDNQRDSDGYLLSALTLVNVSDGTNVTVAHAEQIQLIDWIGTRLVFEQVSTDANTPAANRYGVISYDYAANSRFQLASAAHLNSVLSVQRAIFYAVASDPNNPGVAPAFYKVAPDGSNKQTVLDKEVWSAYRTGYDTISMQTGDGWYAYSIDSGNEATISGPSAYASRIYIDHPANNGHSLWVDIRAGQGVLLDHNRTNNQDTTVLTQAGVTYPLRWLTDDSAIFRVVTGSETADYAVGTVPGQPPHKIADVVNTFGFSTGQ